MATLNIYLLLLLKAKNRIQGQQIYNFDREMRTLTIVLFFFELSYLSRFLWDEFAITFINGNYEFGYFMLYDAITLCDGMSFLAILVFHKRNFT